MDRLAKLAGDSGLRLWTVTPIGILRDLSFPPPPHFAQADDPFEDPMRFSLIDRIVELEPCVRITAVKTLTMTEEYLADHFPHFPVMPGVLMLEALTQAGAWLVRGSEDFAHSIVVLKQANNVKYAQFVEPGQTLAVTAEILKFDEGEVKLKAYGTVGGRIILTPGSRWPATTWPTPIRSMQATDAAIREDLRSQWALLYQPQRKTPAPQRLLAVHQQRYPSMRFEGKTAIVTGGSRGIGRACVARLAAEGAKVALVYHSNQQAAEALLAELKSRPAKSGPFRPTSAISSGPTRSSIPCLTSGGTSTCWSTRPASSTTDCSAP